MSEIVKMSFYIELKFACSASGLYKILLDLNIFEDTSDDASLVHYALMGKCLW